MSLQLIVINARFLKFSSFNLSRSSSNFCNFFSTFHSSSLTSHTNTGKSITECLRNGTICRNYSSNEINTSTPRKLRIGVQGAPFDQGQNKPGTECGPKVIRSSGFIQFIRNTVGHDIKDYGDLPIKLPPRDGEGDQSLRRRHPKIQNVRSVAEANKLISAGASKICRDNRICLTLGGDHSIGIGTLNGVAEVHNDLAILWVDAHCDINTPKTTSSGKMHGMTLAFLIKELQPFMEKLEEFSWLSPRISSGNLAFIGLRDVDPAERTILDTLGITAFSMKEVDEEGIAEVTRKALDKISPGGKRPLHVSFDVDVLDDTVVPNTGTPVPGGLSLREGLTLLERVYQGGSMVSMDLVELNPKLGTKDQEIQTASISKHLIAAAFGYPRGGIDINPQPFGP